MRKQTEVKYGLNETKMWLKPKKGMGNAIIRTTNKKLQTINNLLRDIRKDLMDLDDIVGGTTLFNRANNLIGETMRKTADINMEIKDSAYEIENIISEK